jgi:D-amino-acid dehydrogenase
MIESSAKKYTVSMVGAGIIGVLSALQLQREGHSVTLIDKEPAGAGCSFGNAGIIARSSFVPLSSPSTVWQAPGWLLKSDGPLCVDWRYLLKIIPWLTSYIKAGFKADLVERGEDIHQLTGNALELYKALAAGIECEELITETDYLQVYRTRKGFEKGEGDMNARRRLGFKIENLNAEQLQALEPSLSKDYQYAHHLSEHGFVKDPQALVSAFFDEFIRIGGQFVEQEVQSIQLTGQQCEVHTQTGTIASDKLVVAAGAFSARILKSTGVNLPLETERGYHITCPDPQVAVKRPVMDGDLKFFVTPMSMGHRFAGLVELAGLDKPLQGRRIDVLTRSAKQMLPALNTQDASEWMGFRPTFSDSLPLISTAKDDSRVVYAFGHQHLGLTCAPATATLVSDLIAQRPSKIDVSKYSVERF